MNMSRHNPHQIAGMIRELATLQSQIDAIQAFLREQRGILSKREMKQIARQWGWDIIEGQGKHPTKAVRGHLRVNLTGHGDGHALRRKAICSTLKQLALPVLQDLEAAQAEYLEAVSFYFFEANGHKFVSRQEFYQLKEELNAYQTHNQQLQEWVETLEEEVSQLENEKKLLEEKRKADEQAVLEMLLALETQNAALTAQVQQLQQQVQYLQEKERVAAQQWQIVMNAQRQLETQKMLEDVLKRLKKLQFFLHQCQAVVQQLPALWRQPIQGFLNKMSSILEADLEGSDSHDRQLESDADGTN